MGEYRDLTGITKNKLPQEQWSSDAKGKVEVEGEGISTGLIRASRLGVATTAHSAMKCVTAVISQARVSRRYVRE